MEFYNAGLDGLAEWGSGTYQWALLTAGAFDADDSTVADVLAGATEVTVSGYARQAVDTPVRTVDDAIDRIVYECIDPDFGALGAGQTVTAVVLIQVVTNDADSVPIGWSDITPTATDALSPFVVRVADGTVAYIDQGA